MDIRGASQVLGGGLRRGSGQRVRSAWDGPVGPPKNLDCGRFGLRNSSANPALKDLHELWHDPSSAPSIPPDVMVTKTAANLTQMLCMVHKEPNKSSAVPCGGGYEAKKAKVGHDGTVRQ